MATFSSTFVATLCIFSSIDLAFSQVYEALVVIDNLSSSPDARLPFRAEEENGEIIYPETTEDGRKIEYSYLCPYQSPEVAKEVKKLLATYPEYKYCLEKNPSTTQPLKYCSGEPKPTLIQHRDSRFLKCSKSSDHIPFNFGFNYIKLKHNPSNETPLKPDMVTLRLYDICFNFQQRKRWTRHRVATGLMLQGKGLPSQHIQPPFDYSTEPYRFPKDYFVTMADGYKTQGTNSIYKMVPQMLVPHEDLALKLWKKTTTHFVNTSPLWKNLTPLMKAINDGIRKAGIVVSRGTYQPNTQQSEHLDIYTTTFSPSYRPLLGYLVKTSDIIPPQQFGLSIWCKFIHYENENKGMLIFLHNLPKLPPKKIHYMPTDSKPVIFYENTECKMPVPCNFRKWADEPQGLSDDLLNYAYCCPADKKTVEELFDITLDTELGLLDMDGLNEQSTQRIYIFL